MHPTLTGLTPMCVEINSEADFDSCISIMREWNEHCTRNSTFGWGGSGAPLDGLKDYFYHEDPDTPAHFLDIRDSGTVFAAWTNNANTQQVSTDTFVAWLRSRLGQTCVQFATDDLIAIL